MTIGTKSVLYGAHQFLLHPLFVAWGWWLLYGFPFDPRLWIAFIIHDLGYIGQPNLDGPEGKMHPNWAARFMDRWFGESWGDLCFLHSRSMARWARRPPSRLCMADKMVTSLTPAWLYLPMARATGELEEYMGVWKGTFTPEAKDLTPEQWYALLGKRTRAWAMKHRDERMAA